MKSVLKRAQVDLFFQRQDELNRVIEKRLPWLRLDEVVLRNVEFLYMNVIHGVNPIVKLVDASEGSVGLAALYLVRFLIVTDFADSRRDESTGLHTVTATTQLVRESGWMFDERIAMDRFDELNSLVLKAADWLVTIEDKDSEQERMVPS